MFYVSQALNQIDVDRPKAKNYMIPLKEVKDGSI